MIRRLFFLFTFLLLGFALRAQYTALGISARSALEHLEENESLELVLVSSHSSMPDQLEQESIPFTTYFSKYYRIKARKEHLEFLTNNALIEFIESPSMKPVLLNDSMLTNNKVLELHKGLSPYKKSYTGNGVVLGFIDTGIDFLHPDFQDSTGKTRVIQLWDQGADTLNSNRIPTFGYGQVWDSTDINAGSCPHDDDVLSHGTNVAGIAAGNGLALNQYYGVATESDIVFVATDFSASNWLQTVADGVEYIFKECDKMNKPCVINISAGDYLGSHDGSDLAAMRIDSMIKAKRGRAVVAAAGNAGHIPFHLGYQVSSDTSFTWFKYNPSSGLGFGTVYYQLWSDTADFNQVTFAFGANKNGGSFQFRGQTAFDDISNRLNVLHTDSIHTGNHLLARVETYAQLMGDKYLLEVNIKQPDSSQYLYSFMATGSGQFDVWSDTWMGTSNIYKAPLPSASVLPSIQFYQAPDSLQSMVSSFTCLPSVITVANYVNRNTYIDVNNAVQTFPVTPGLKALTSSLGPNRKGYQKPDLIASGDYTLTANRLASIPLHIANNQADRIGQGGKHKRNGGTSMAAPVVSGITALLFEECSNLKYDEIRSRLTSHTTIDAQTGSTPNYAYGYGKVNAAASLGGSYYKAIIDPQGHQLICASSQLELSGPEDMSAYSWSTGDSSRRILVDSTTIITLVTVDSSGCESSADTVYLTQVAKPGKPIITKIAANNLQSSLALAYQWYQNGNPLQGETNRTLTISTSAYYHVEVFDTNNCSNSSDSLEMFVGISDMESGLDMRIYPNPSNDGYYYFECTTCTINEHVDLTVYDALGSMILSEKIESGQMINLNHCSGSFYYFTIANRRGEWTTGKLLRN